jgi:hypothetical protein
MPKRHSVHNEYARDDHIFTNINRIKKNLTKFWGGGKLSRPSFITNKKI